MAYKCTSQLSDTAWIVEEEFKTISSSFVMKKVECGDEIEANELFYKMREHQKLSHPFLVPFHHLFISWDENRAVYLCIVSHHMSKGSLSQFLASQRENCQWMEKTLLQKWMGQLIEGLVFIHRHHLCHRRLKSSNIYLKDDESLCIGDQAPTLKSCITQSSLNWFPPETVTLRADDDSSYDERSDIWSLGCVFLEMATTGCINSTEFLADLFQLKINPCILDGLLNKVSTQYDNDISQLIQMMLRQSYHQRPLAIDLCDKPFVRSCFSLYESSLLEELSGITHEQSLLAAKLRKNKYSVNMLVSILDDLISYLQEDPVGGDEKIPLNQSVQELIVDFITQYKSVSNLVVKCLNVLYLSSGNIDTRVDDIISLTAGVLQVHSNDSSVVKSGVQLLVSLSIEDSSVINMIRLRLPNLTLKLAESFTEYPDVLCPSFVLLTNLIKPKAVLEAAVRGKMVDLVCKALLNHSHSSSLVLSGLTLLWASISSEDALMIVCTRSNATLFSRLIHLHVEDMMVVRICLGLIVLLCRTKEDISYSMVDQRNTPCGLSIVFDILRYQHYDCDVLEQTLSLIAELAKYDDIQAEMVQSNVGELLSGCMSETNSKYLNQELKDQLQSLITLLILVNE